MKFAEQHRTERATLAPVLLTELTYASFGDSVKQSAQAQEITEGGVKNRRKLINKHYGARNIRQAIVEGIQTGDLPIQLKDESDPLHLSPTQHIMLALAVNGYYAEEIAKRCTVSRHTVNSNFEAIRHQLNARNINHAMRRAFELGLFKAGEEIVDPIEQQEQKTRDLQVAVGGVALRPSEIGISNLNELELLSLLRNVDVGYFSSKTMADLGFLENADSETSRYHAFGRAASSVSSKLAQAFGQQILEKVGNNGSSRRYIVKAAVEVGTPGEMNQIAAFKKNETNKRRGPGIASRQMPTRKPGKKDRPRVYGPNASVSENEYLDHSTLPELTRSFLLNLGKRDPQEVLENTPVKIALDALTRQGYLIDHRLRVVTALRYGVSTDLTKSPIMIRRNGSYIPLKEVMPYVPPYQGIDVESASQILGLRPLAILQAERALIDSCKDRYPSLKRLEAGIKRQILALRAS